MTAPSTGAVVLRCPVHGIPDCSPLLNGCSIPSALHRAFDAGRAEAKALLADETTVEKVAEAIAPGPWWRHVHAARAALAAIAGLLDEEADRG